MGTRRCVPDTLNVIVKQPGEHGRWATIPNTLEALQGIVGGYIEPVTFGMAPFTELILLCDEEGKFKGLPENIRLTYDTICGPVVILGGHGDEFVDCPVTMDEWEEIVRRYE